MCVVVFLVKFGWLGGRLFGGWLLIRLAMCVHGISTLLLDCFFPASVFGVGIIF